MRIDTRKVERRLAAATREGRRLRREDLSESEITALLSDIDRDYQDRTGGVSQGLWDWAHENFADEIAAQRKAHFAQQARDKKAREKQDAETLEQNLAGKAWAPVFVSFLRDRAFSVNGSIFYPLALEYWQADCQKMVDEADAQKLPLDDPQNIATILRNQMLAGEVHAVDLMTGQTLTGSDLRDYELIGELLKPTEQRRDFRTAEEFDATDPAILAEERRINDELLMLDLDAEFRRLAKTEPSFHDTEENRRKLFDYARANDLALRQESLAAAFREMWTKGLIGKIPNVDIEVGFTSARINPKPWRDESDQAQAFRRAAGKMTSEQFDAACEDPEFKRKADLWL